MTTTEEKINIMEAHLARQAIEVRFVVPPPAPHQNAWHETPFPLWDWDKFEYRMRVRQSITPLSLHAKLKVMIASEDGATIERDVATPHEIGQWAVDASPTWNWQKYTYRIQP